jgi:hypothetical protein
LDQERNIIKLILEDSICISWLEIWKYKRNQLLVDEINQNEKVDANRVSAPVLCFKLFAVVVKKLNR